MNRRQAISKIEKNGVLLVFPVNNRPEPRSLWSEFFPRSKMRWEWDDDGDDRVARLWRLMKELSDCRRVVYSKWYQGRATFFSRALFGSLLRVRSEAGDPVTGLSRAARELFEALSVDSPLSTKELKRATGLQGRDNEPSYNRGLKELFSRLLIVAFGEVDDGAFPSLAVGSTRLLYEDLWAEAREMDPEAARATIDRFMPQGSSLRKFWEKSLPKPAPSPEPAPQAGRPSL